MKTYHNKKTETQNIKAFSFLFQEITGIVLLSITGIAILFMSFLYIQLALTGNFTSIISSVIYG